MVAAIAGSWLLSPHKTLWRYDALMMAPVTYPK